MRLLHESEWGGTREELMDRLVAFTQKLNDHRHTVGEPAPRESELIEQLVANPGPFLLEREWRPVHEQAQRQLVENNRLAAEEAMAAQNAVVAQAAPTPQAPTDPNAERVKGRTQQLRSAAFGTSTIDQVRLMSDEEFDQWWLASVSTAQDLRTIVRMLVRSLVV